MKPIFNSLGSNYSLKFVLTAFGQIFFKNNSSKDDLRKYLEDNYGGKPLLFYKGRGAIEFSLKVLLGSHNNGNSDKNIGVLTQAFSCYAVEEGIKRAGMIPIYVDTDKNSTNMSVETLNDAFSKNKDARAVLVQHSLGIPANISAIKKWCDKNNLLLIEDLAQAIGGVDGSGQPLGEHADAVIFSFGRDKIIDAVSGGAAAFKDLNPEHLERIDDIEVKKLPLGIFLTDMLYPLITFIGRSAHNIFFGKVVLKLSTIFGLISSPTISKVSGLTKMHPAYSKLAMMSLRSLEKQISARRKIANYYFEKIKNKNVAMVNSQKDIESGSNLRFSIRVKNVDKLIAEMKKNKIYLSDRWYRSAVDCGRTRCSSTYSKGSAKNAEKLADEILNLPTHKNISLQKAERIVTIVNSHE